MLKQMCQMYALYTVSDKIQGMHIWDIWNWTRTMIGVSENRDIKQADCVCMD